MLTRWTVMSMVLVGLCGALSAQEPAAGRSRIEVWVGEARYRPQHYALWDAIESSDGQVVSHGSWQPMSVSVVHDVRGWNLVVRWEREFGLEQRIPDAEPTWNTIELTSEATCRAWVEAFDLGAEWSIRLGDHTELHPSAGLTFMRTQREILDRSYWRFPWTLPDGEQIDYHSLRNDEYREQFSVGGAFGGAALEVALPARLALHASVLGRWGTGSAKGQWIFLNGSGRWRGDDHQYETTYTVMGQGSGRRNVWMLAADLQLTWAATEWLELGGGWRWRDWGSEWQPGVIHGPFASLAVRF